MLAFFAAALTFMSVELVLRLLLPRSVLNDDYDGTYANAIIKGRVLKANLTPVQTRKVRSARLAVAVWFGLSILVLMKMPI